MTTLATLAAASPDYSLAQAILFAAFCTLCAIAIGVFIGLRPTHAALARCADHLARISAMLTSEAQVKQASLEGARVFQGRITCVTYVGIAQSQSAWANNSAKLMNRINSSKVYLGVDVTQIHQPDVVNTGTLTISVEASNVQESMRHLMELIHAADFRPGPFAEVTP
jgi:hypothetical protein